MNERLNTRIGLIVWIKNLNDQKKLYQYGNVAYVSKKLLYVYLYVKMEDVERIQNQLKKANFVKKFSLSKKPELDFSSEHSKESIQELHDEAIKINEENRAE